MLQSEAGYIDARPLTANSTKFSCNARPDHTLSQQRRIEAVNSESGLPQLQMAANLCCGHSYETLRPANGAIYQSQMPTKQGGSFSKNAMT
jgi:hypothetical protein